MKTLLMAVVVSIATINFAYATHTDKEHVEKYDEAEQIVEINANDTKVNQRKSSVKRNSINNDFEDSNDGLIYSENNPYKDLDF